MPRAKKFRLITDKEELRALCGGRWSRNPRPRCNICLSPTKRATVDSGRVPGTKRVEVIGRWCPKCRHFFKKRLVTKTVATYAEV